MPGVGISSFHVGQGACSPGHLSNRDGPLLVIDEAAHPVVACPCSIDGLKLPVNLLLDNAVQLVGSHEGRLDHLQISHPHVRCNHPWASRHRPGLTREDLGYASRHDLSLQAEKPLEVAL